MLKIKDNIDLKVLEKYGFKEYKYDYRTKKVVIVPCYCYECECSEEDTEHNKAYENQDNFIVSKKTNLISRMTYGGKQSYYFNIMQPEDYNLLYDLIQAGLVEKADNNE